MTCQVTVSRGGGVSRGLKKRCHFVKEIPAFPAIGAELGRLRRHHRWGQWGSPRDGSMGLGERGLGVLLDEGLQLAGVRPAQGVGLNQPRAVVGPRPSAVSGVCSCPPEGSEGLCAWGHALRFAM